MNEWHIWKYAMNELHISKYAWMCYIYVSTPMNALFISGYAMTNVWFCITCVKEACHTYECVMQHMFSFVWMSHATYANASGHKESCHVWMSHVTRMNESCHTYRCCISHVCKGHVTRMKMAWWTHTHTHTWAMTRHSEIPLRKVTLKYL